MIFDFRTSSTPNNYIFDVCIIGAGAAGMTLAKALSRYSRLSIGVIESGNLQLEDATQALYGIQSVGHPYFEPDGSRMRLFGGSTNHWGGQVLPIDRNVFAGRSWLEGDGWPLDLKTIIPYYMRALGDLRIPAKVLDRNVQLNHLMAGRSWLPTDGNIENRLKFISKDFLPEVYQKILDPLQNVTVITNANLTSIDTVPNTSGEFHTKNVHIRDLSGEVTGQVSARFFVLACGGIENARILLNAKRHGVSGMGGSLVGCYFQDHPHLINALTLYSTSDLFSSYAYYDVEDVTCVGNAVLSQQAQETHGVMSAALSCADTSKQLEEQGSIWRVYDVSIQSEQSPSKNSRILLGNQTDRLGQWTTVVDWRLGDHEMETIRTASKLFAAQVSRLGLGRVKINRVFADGDWTLANVTGGAHHMGTTRMSRLPAEGVVDLDCRLHGNDNFYIAGSSVFPTGGYENPTLTVIALAHRLSDHLDAKLQA